MREHELNELFRTGAYEVPAAADREYVDGRENLAGRYYAFSTQIW